MMSALPPRSGESPRRGTSRLEMMQARFQAKQLEEKEEKMIHLLEEKQERTIQRVNYGRDSANSTNSFSSSASSNSVNGGIGMRPPMYGGAGGGGGGGGRVRQMFDQRRATSPVGWDKSYPLDPVNNAAVEAVNPEVTRTPLYKQNVARTNSYNKYSGNYGPRAGAGQGQYGKRGMSLDRNKARGDSRLGYTGSMSRAHSQANIGSSSEDSYPGSRPYSGLGYHGSGSGNLRTRKPSGSGSQSGLMTRSSYAAYGAQEPVSPEDSPPTQRKSYGTLSRDRDYTRPMPPAYRRQKSMSRMTEPSPSRHSYHQDSAYSSHSSQSSDNHSANSASNSAFSVISSVPSPAVNRPPLSTQSSPSKSYSRQNSFNYDPSRTINSRTFRKQKSPVRHRSPSISPSRSAENSDETDLAVTDDYGTAGSRGVSRNAERAREEERRRMQVEMRKREQELLAKIKEQQKELDLVKADKAKVEKELTRAEREREDERRLLEVKEREMEIQRKEEERRERQEALGLGHRRQQPPAASYERVLNREKASPAHLRGRRPPSLVSSENDEEVKMINTAGLAPPTTITIPITKMSEDDVMLSSVKPPALVASDRDSVSPQRSAPPPVRPGDSASLLRRNSLRRARPEPGPASVSRTGSFRIKKQDYDPKPRVPQSPSAQRREPPKVTQSPSAQRKVPPSPQTQRRVPASPSLRRREPSPKPTITRESLRKKAAESDSWAKEDSKASSSGVQAVQARSSASLGLNRLRGPSREPSFDDDKESVTNSRSGAKTRTTTYISPAAANSRNSSDSHVKDAKKSVPPSPAPKKKTPSTPARKSIFAPKARDDLTACKMCGRNFADDRIEKHEEICSRTAEKAKKRKVFDMTKARVKGTDAAKYVKSAAHLEKKEAKEQKKSDWRKKREDFIATLRAAKEAQKFLAAGGSIKDLPPPPPMDTSDYIQCPHCSRRFAEAAAERHIPKCKDIKSNKRR